MAINTKIIHLDKNFEIIDGNREYYIYFERIGHRFCKIDEIVHPSQRDEFIEFIKNAKSSNDFIVLKFRKYTSEYLENIVRVSKENLKGDEVFCISLTEIYDVLNFLKKAEVETIKLRETLGLTFETFFAYQKTTNNFRLLKYEDGKGIVLFEQDIDSWKKSVIESKFISEEHISEFLSFIDNLKACPSRIYATFDSSLRTSGKIMESLDFIGIRNDSDGEISVNGRVLLSSRAKHDFNANSLINELQVDPLTKCYNKKTISEMAMNRVKDARENEKFALIIVDLDHFKPVNDAYGHLAGDKILEQAGELLRNIIGINGSVGRYGGDEFFIILNNCNNEIILRGTLQAILEHVRNHFGNSFDNIKITASIGASVYPDNGKTYEELFKKADFCLYRAKDKGRNRYVFFREDIHLKLFKESIEDTVGVKYQGREILELKYMSAFMQALGVTPYRAIKEVLEHMKETYSLDNITIYYGEDMNRIYTIGEELDELQNAKYALTDEFKVLVSGKNYVRMDFPEDLRNSVFIRDTFLDRKIHSTIQCVLGSPNEITGLVAFNRFNRSAQWAEYEVNCAVMFASSFNLLPESTKVDFALYSKLKNNSK